MGTGYERRPVVLAVDDDLGVRESLCEVLCGDYEVLEAADGQPALDIVRARSVDVILLDLLMPGLDGFEVLKRLRERGCSSRIIVITGRDEIQSAVTAMRLGAWDYVTKPFDVDHIVALVRRAATAPRKEVLLVGGSLGLRGSLTVIAEVYGDASVVTRSSPPVTIPPDDSNGCLMVDIAGGVNVSALLSQIAPHKPRLGPISVAVIEHVAKHYASTTVEKVARSLGLTADHLTRLFRMETTITVKHYLSRVRIEVAKYLRTETGDTQAAIAERAGFCDASHLSRVCRSIMGVPPGRLWRSRPGR